MLRRRYLLLPLCVLLASCQSHDQAPATAAPAAAASAPAAASAGASNQASYRGFGDMRFGMDEAAFRQAWSGELTGGAAPGSGCAMFAPIWTKPPAELSFMLEHGRFVRYDVRGAKEIAPGGGRAGMDKAQLLGLYSHDSMESPAKYEPGASQLRVEDKSGGVLIFDIGADGKVKAWRVGVPPQIDYVEGCS